MAYISTQEVAEKRNLLKSEFPTTSGWKFSVRRDDASGIRVNILEGPVDFETKHEQINHHKVDRYKHSEILQKIVDIVEKGNYDNSNAQIDYFDVGFYVHIEIGKWDKEYIYIQSKN